MYDKAQIIKLLASQKKKLEQIYPISEMGLFGSYARGDNNEYSDIDILIDFNERIDGFDYIRIAHALEVPSFYREKFDKCLTGKDFFFLKI